MPAFTSLTTTPAAAENPHPRSSLLERLRHKVVSTAHTTGRTYAQQDPLDSFTWPVEPTIEALGEAVSAARGLAINIMPIPDEMRHREITGLTTVNGQTAYVFYDENLALLHWELTIFHEYAHILHRDVQADSDCTHLRSMFDDPVEKRAETTGMRLLETWHRRQKTPERRRETEVLAFFSGTDENSGL